MVLAAASQPLILGVELHGALAGLCRRFREEWDDVRDWPAAAKRLALLSDRLREDRPFLAMEGTPIESTFVIDLFCQLEWLLQSLLLLPHSRSMRDSALGDQARTGPLSDDLAHEVTQVLKLIRPTLDTWRCIYAACTFSATARSKFLSNPTPVMDGARRDQFLAQYENSHGGSFSLQNLLESVKSHEKPPISTPPLALVDMLDLMLEIASIMRIWEECKFSHGHLIPQNLCLYRTDHDFGYRIELRYEPTISPSAGNCYMAPEIALQTPKFRALRDRLVHLENSASDVYSYGSVCFNILTADVPGALKSTQAIQSRTEFYEFVRGGEWKQMVHGKPEYLVRLIAWCWETDPKKRPAFSTICSLLQRAMRCLIFPPVLNLTRLSNFLQKSEYSLLNLYLSFVWSRDISCHVWGLGALNEMVQMFHHDTIEQQHFSSDFMCSKVMQAFAHIKAYRRMMHDPSNVEALVLNDANSTESANHPSSVSSHSGDKGSVQQHQIFLSESRLIEKVEASCFQLFGASTQVLKPGKDFVKPSLPKSHLHFGDCGSVQQHPSFLSKLQLTEKEEDLPCEIGELELGSLIELEKEFDSRSDTVLNSDVFEQHSIMFEALAYDCMLASFPPLDYQFWIRPLIDMSHHNQKLPIPLPNVPFKRNRHINHALLPHLIGCWAGQTCSRGN